MLLSAVLERILLSYGRSREKFLQSFSKSMLLSVDVGHGLHPNKTDKNDPTAMEPKVPPLVPSDRFTNF